MVPSNREVPKQLNCDKYHDVGKVSSNQWLSVFSTQDSRWVEGNNCISEKQYHSRAVRPQIANF